MLLDYQALMYAPVYDTFGQAATLATTGGDSIAITIVNKTAPSPFAGFGVEFQAFKPSAMVRMAELLTANLVPIDDILGGELTMDGKTWSIKSYEHVPSPVGVNDGELRLFLKDDVDV
jgi:hypothetical protein